MGFKQKVFPRTPCSLTSFVRCFSKSWIRPWTELRIGVRLLAKNIFPIGSFPKVRLSNLRRGSLQWGLSAVACPDIKNS